MPRAASRQNYSFKLHRTEKLDCFDLLCKWPLIKVTRIRSAKETMFNDKSYHYLLPFYLMTILLVGGKQAHFCLHIQKWIKSSLGLTPLIYIYIKEVFWQNSWLYHSAFMPTLLSLAFLGDVTKIEMILVCVATIDI